MNHSLGILSSGAKKSLLFHEMRVKKKIFTLLQKIFFFYEFNRIFKIKFTFKKQL